MLQGRLEQQASQVLLAPLGQQVLPVLPEVQVQLGQLDRLEQQVLQEMTVKLDQPGRLDLPEPLDRLGQLG